MNPDRISWNANVINSIFPQHLRCLVLSTPIFSGEPDKLIWNPTVSGTFTVRSAYRAINHARFCTASRLDKRVWELLWRSNLHERHKVLVWKLLNGLTPTKCRINGIVPVPDLSCFLCNASEESIEHLLFECPIAIICWMQSAWQIRIEQFKDRGCVHWFQLLLDDGNLLPIDGETKDRVLHFAAVCFEQMWLQRNRLRLGGGPINWNSFAKSISRLADLYWQGGCARKLQRRRGSPVDC